MVPGYKVAGTRYHYLVPPSGTLVPMYLVLYLSVAAILIRRSKAHHTNPPIQTTTISKTMAKIIMGSFLISFAGLVFSLFPTHIASCDVISTQNSPGFFHWTCSGCHSKFGCCNRIQFSHQLANAKKDALLGHLTFNAEECVEKIATVPGVEGAFSFISYERKLSQSRRLIDENVNFVAQQFRDGKWNSTLQPQFNVAPIMLNQVYLNSNLSISGGIHRTLSVSLSMANVQGQGTYSLLLFLTEDFFVDIERLIEEQCVGEFAYCSVSIHSDHDEIIDTEAPSNISPQHVVRLEVSWQTPMVSEPSLFFALAVHSRYPVPKGGYLLAKLPSPVILGIPLARNEKMHQEMPLMVFIPAGHSDDYVFIVIATGLCSVIGSILILRELSKVSKWN